MVGDDDRLLSDVQARVEALAGLPAGPLIHELRPVVTDVMLAIRADGSWFDADVVQEALAMVVDVADAAIADQDPSVDVLGAEDRRFLDACRSGAQARQLIEDMLDDLHRSIRPPGPNAGER